MRMMVARGWLVLINGNMTSPGPPFCGWSQTVKDRLQRSGNTAGGLEDSFFEVVRIFLAQEMGVCCCLAERGRGEGSWIADIHHVWASWWLPHAGRAQPVLRGTPAKVSERLELLDKARQFLKKEQQSYLRLCGCAVLKSAVFYAFTVKSRWL